MAKVFGGFTVNVIIPAFVIIYNLNCFTCADLKETEKYEIYPAAKYDYTPLIINFRVKRETIPQTAQKIQYQSVPVQNETQTVAVKISDSLKSNLNTTESTHNLAINRPIKIDPSLILNYNASEQRLLGVNGTGQRQDLSSIDITKQQTPNATDATTHLENIKLNLGAVLADTSLDISDKVDVPENETLSELERHGLVNQTTDYHEYYNSTIYTSKAEATQIWQIICNSTPNSLLSTAHRRAMTVELTFDFPFYGHSVRNITVATGGFLYTGEYVHSWLAATQYIAPLMANFDTSLSTDSVVRLNDNGTAFTVIWENVTLQDKREVGPFTFSTTLHQNGDIVFVYYNIPIMVNSIEDNKHPVKVGLSDAYIFDKMIFFARRKTIYEYHRVNFANTAISNSTIVRLIALPTCPSYNDCAACINHNTSFDCAWCPILNRCSSGTDRKKQEWIRKGCDRAQMTDTSVCPALGQKGNNANNPNASYTDYNIPNYNEHQVNQEDAYHSLLEPINNQNANVDNFASSAAVSKAVTSNANTNEHRGMGLVLSFLIPTCLVMMILMWVFYAYRNPHTKSGQILIQYRPGQWSWRRGEARYTAATIHM